MCIQALSCKKDPADINKDQWNAFWLSAIHCDRSSLYVSDNSVPVPHILDDFAVPIYHYACRAYHVKR